jgi:hypothetical protein
MELYLKSPKRLYYLVEAYWYSDNSVNFTGIINALCVAYLTMVKGETPAGTFSNWSTAQKRCVKWNEYKVFRH